MVPGLTFNSLINFSVDFFHGIRKGSNFIILYVDIYFSQHCLLKNCSFYLKKCPLCNPKVILCWKLVDHMCLVYFRDLSSIPLVRMSVFMPVACCFDYCLLFCNIIWNQKVCYLQLCFLLQDCFSYSGVFLWFHINFRIFYFCKKCQWNFNKDHIDSIHCIG